MFSTSSFTRSSSTKATAVSSETSSSAIRLSAEADGTVHEYPADAVQRWSHVPRHGTRRPVTATTFAGDEDMSLDTPPASGQRWPANAAIPA